jgi:DHA1 family multidrug resistance protein-like MFS transporter
MFTVVYSIFFFAVGGIEPVIMSITAESTPSSKRGMIFGVQALVGSMAWAVSPVIGSVVSIKFSIQSILVFVPIFFSLALITTFAMKNREKAQVNNQ